MRDIDGFIEKIRDAHTSDEALKTDRHIGRGWRFRRDVIPAGSLIGVVRYHEKGTRIQFSLCLGRVLWSIYKGEW